MDKKVLAIAEKSLAGNDISVDEAGFLCKGADIYDLLYWSNRIREKYKGRDVELCSIVNAKSGKCSEDCVYCSQSGRYKTDVPEHPLLGSEQMIAAARESKEAGSHRFGIVTSGRTISGDDEAAALIDAVSIITRELKMEVCGSLGTLSEEYARRFFDAGLRRYNHNLETAESFFANTCTTHSYQDRVATVKMLKSIGYEVCCGGIFGMGESWEQRVEFAFTLKDLNVDTCTMNFLNPVPGTPLADMVPLAPMEILRIVALYRFVLFNRNISICGGREKNLRDLQSWIFYAGANATMLGNYLTTAGRPPEEDKRMIRDLELQESAE